MYWLELHIRGETFEITFNLEIWEVCFLNILAVLQRTHFFWERGDLPLSTSVVLACFHSHSVLTEALSGQGISQFRVITMAMQPWTVYSLFKAKDILLFFLFLPHTTNIFCLFVWLWCVWARGTEGFPEAVKWHPGPVVRCNGTIHGVHALVLKVQVVVGVRDYWFLWPIFEDWILVGFSGLSTACIFRSCF